MIARELTSSAHPVHNGSAAVVAPARGAWIETTYLTNFKETGVIEHGSVNTHQKCPQCSKKFTADSFDRHGFICSNGCDTRPTRYIVVARSLGLQNPLYKDPQTGLIFETYSQAFGVLMALNREYQEAKRLGKRFKADNWIPSEMAAKQMKHICEMRLAVYEKEIARDKKSTARIANFTKASRFIIEHLGDRDIRDIDEADIEQFYLKLIDTPVTPRGKGDIDLSKTLSSRYIKDILNELRSLFLKYRPKDIPNFPEFNIIPAVRKQILGVTREMAVMDLIPERHGYRLAIEILLQTGMRINEVRALLRSDLLDGMIIVNKSICDSKENPNDIKFARKSGGEVFAKVTTDLWTRLQAHVQGKKSDDLIFSIGGKPLGGGRLYKVLKKACADAGVEHISLQQASRHSTATRIKRKHDENAYAEIEEVLGHDNRTTGKEHYIVAPDITKN